MNTDYLEINKQLWNQKTDIHSKSEFYDMESFLAGTTTLKSIELALLGDVRGKRILHLQCHFGQDTLSLARMGAIVTGLDISDESIDLARSLNTQLGLDATFVCCDLYSAKEHIDEKFDIVFSSYGTIGWLPDMDKWAGIVSHFIKPSGQFIFVELHPVVWMYDDVFEKVALSYFNKEAIIETNPGTYAEQEAEIEMKEVGWNHPLSEVMTALMNQKLKITHFEEFDYSPHKCFLGMTETGNSEYIIESLGNKIPMTYSLIATF